MNDGKEPEGSCDSFNCPSVFVSGVGFESVT